MAFCRLVALFPAVLLSRQRLEVSPKCWSLHLKLHDIPSKKKIVLLVLIILRITGVTFAVNYTAFDAETKCKVLMKITYYAVRWKNHAEGWIFLCIIALNIFCSYETNQSWHKVGVPLLYVVIFCFVCLLCWLLLCAPLCLCVCAQVVLVYHLRGICAVLDHHQLGPAVHTTGVPAHQLPAHLPTNPAIQPLHHHVWLHAHPLLR